MDRLIKTAGKDSKLKIEGWIQVGGYIKEMAVVPDAQESLISIVKLTLSNLETRFRAHPYMDCALYENGNLITSGIKHKRNNLFYIDILHLVTEGLVAKKIEFSRT